MWYNETALKIPGAAATAQALGAIGRNAVRRDNDKGGRR